MELRDYIRILRKRWVLIALLTLIGLGAAAGYSILQTPKFTSSAKVFVSTSGGETVGELQQGNTFTQQRVKTYASLATTPIVLLPVIADLGIDRSAESLARNVNASAPLNETLIEITVVDNDPALAAELATEISESLTNVVESIEKTSTDAVSPVRLTLVQHASVPQSPTSPNVPLNLALGTLVGLALGIGLAVLLETLDTRIRNERDVEVVSDRPIIGGIAYDAKAAERPLIVHVDPRSPRAESFRTLRTNLQFLDVGHPSRAFVVTSSIESEGKSTTAANLAIALGDAGARVLLVDADLRRPKVDQYMGVEGGAGLTDLLIGRAELQDVVQKWGRGQLYVLPAGRIPPNPSELLGSAAMVRLLEEFSGAFDVILFDAPPLLPVTDAAILSRVVAGAIVVVAAGRTHKNQLKGAVGALENVGATISGFVLTMMPTKGPDAYGYGRYGYGYGYGYGIEEGEKADKADKAERAAKKAKKDAKTSAS